MGAANCHCNDGQAAKHKTEVVETVKARGALAAPWAPAGASPEQRQAGLLVSACLLGDAQSTRQLLHSRADPNALDADGDLPLATAARLGRWEVVALLLAARAEPGRRSSIGTVALVSAAFGGHCTIVRQLLAARADTEQQDVDGDVALVGAAGEGHEELVRLLLAARADPAQKASSKSYRGTALEAAAREGHTSIVDFLQEAVRAAEAEAAEEEAKKPHAEPSFGTSHFKGVYTETKAPEMQHQLFDALHRFLRPACARASSSTQEADGFFLRLQEEALKATMEKGDLSEVQSIAARLWSSNHKVAGREFCSYLNGAIRADDPELMPYAAVIVRGLNQLCVHRDEAAKAAWSKDAVGWQITYRGGGLPDEHRGFFVPGKKYRVPMFLATTSKNDLARKKFARDAGEAGLPPVLWIVHLNEEYGCLHGKYLGQNSIIPGEDEFLFAPYSTFEVAATRWRDPPTWMSPHEVELKAAVDNKLEPEDLPLAPWH